MSDAPAYADLAGIPSGVLCGLVTEFVAAHVDRTQEPWAQHFAVLRAVDQALRAAARGRLPEAERAAPPRQVDTASRARITDLSTLNTGSAEFAEIRVWERLGLVTLPHDDAYVLAMVSALSDPWDTVDRADLLRGDPELREVLWRVFEVEGGGEVSLAAVDRHGRADAGWQVTFLALVDDGTLDRGRVLRSCLSALQRDFSAFRAQWFSLLYRSLRPTIEEGREHQGAYRALLRSGVGATVSLAARRLKAVSAADALDDDGCAALAPGLSARTKGPALDVLRVLDDVARRRPDLHPVLAATVPVACEHPHVDVQRAAVALLVRLGADPLAHADALAPSLRAELGIPAGATVPAAGPVGPPVAAVVPVTAADLLDRTAALLEDASDPLEVELVLAGLAACADPEVLAPLRKRADRMIRGGPPDGADRDWLRGQFARLVLVRPPMRSMDSRVQFLVRRLVAVADVLAGHRPPTVLLATPDSADGFLDPARLVDRLARTAEPWGVEDLTAALLRLGAGGREAAQRQLVGDDDTTRIVRHALGAPAPEALRGPPALWVAAARARHPGADDELLLRAGLDRAGQGRAVRARIEATAELVHERYADTTRPFREVSFTVRVEHPAARPDPRQPLLATGVDDDGGRDGWEQWVGWLLATSPHDVEPVLTDLVRPVLDAGVGGGVSHDATRVLTGLARHPGPLGPLGHATLAAGLTADRADHRVLAVDAVAGFVGTGRPTPTELAAAMASLQLTAVPVRWAGALANLAVACPGPFVADVLTALLPALPGGRRGAYALVELLREETARGGRRVTDPALRGWLDTVPGRGRGPRAARALLA